MKATEPPTRCLKTTPRKSAADALRKSKARYRRLFETEKDTPAAVPHELQTHLAEGLLIVDLLDLSHDLAANVTIPRAEVTAFDKIAAARIRHKFHAVSQWADQFFGISPGARDETSIESNTTNVHAAIAAIVKDLRSQRTRKKIFFDLQLEASDHQVNFGPEKFRQILTDLILASIKFAPNKGLIHLVSYNASPGAMIVRVGENRIGPETKDAVPICSPLEQADAPVRSKNGETGLSLSVARSLVQAHNGKLVVQSPSKSSGTTFILKLKTTPVPADLSANGALRLAMVRVFPADQRINRLGKH
jgi:two-component system sensor histidine kinase ResE